MQGKSIINHSLKKTFLNKIGSHLLSNMIPYGFTLLVSTLSITWGLSKKSVIGEISDKNRADTIKMVLNYQNNDKKVKDSIFIMLNRIETKVDKVTLNQDSTKNQNKKLTKSVIDLGKKIFTKDQWIDFVQPYLSYELNEKKKLIPFSDTFNQYDVLGFSNQMWVSIK